MRRLPLLLALTQVVTAPQPCAASEAPALRVALHALTGEADLRRAALLRGALQRELEKLEGLVVADALSAEARSDRSNECADSASPSCLTRLAAALGADEVVRGNVAYLGDTAVLSLKRIRLRDVVVVQATTRRLAADNGVGLLLVLGEAVQDLFPERRAKAGEHLGVPIAVASRFAPSAVRPWLVWSGAAATALAAAGGGAFALSARSAEKDYQRFIAIAATTPVDGRTLIGLADRARTRTTYANLCWGATAVLGLGTALLGWFADWGADPDWLVVPSVASSVVPGRGTVLTIHATVRE